MLHVVGSWYVAPVCPGFDADSSHMKKVGCDKHKSNVRDRENGNKAN